MGLTCKTPVANGWREGNEVPIFAYRPIGRGQRCNNLFAAAAATFVDNGPVTLADVENPFFQSFRNCVHISRRNF